MPDPKTLPFELNEPAVAEWLNKISIESPVNAASQLNQVLATFRKTKVSDKNLLPLLLKLAPVSLHSSHTLNKLLKSDVPDHKTLKIAKLSLLLLRNQSLALLQITNATATEKADILYAVFYALQFIGQYLRLSSQFQELPSETLWQVSGELYIIAQQHELLDLPVSSKISEFRQQHCIIDIIKRNILFTLTGFHRLSASDNQMTYEFSNDYGNLIALKHVPDRHDLFSWEIGQNLPCFAQENPHKTAPSQQLSIDTTRLQSILRPASFKTPISNDLIDHLLKVCTGYSKQMNDDVPSPPVIFGLCIGIKACHTYLSQQQRLNRIQHLSAQVKEEESFINMSLMPLDHEKKLQDNALTQPSSISAPSLQSLINAKITQTNQSDYILAQTQQQGCNAGELILLINSKNVIIPGIVRQVKINTVNSSAKLLIEKFKVDLIPHHFYCEQNDMSGQLISINENSDQPELFLPYAKYRNGSKIQFNNRTARLVSLVDHSLSFTRFRIIFD